MSAVSSVIPNNLLTVEPVNKMPPRRTITSRRVSGQVPSQSWREGTGAFMAKSLFGEDLEERIEAEPEPVQSHPGPFAGVALENSLDRVLDYAVPPKLIHELHVGQRVRVPLGRNNRPALGYVVSIRPTTTYPRIKPLSGIDDDRVLVTPALMDLARWMSRYYCTPLGTVLESVIPSAVKKKVGLGYAQMVRVTKDAAELQAIFEKTKAAKRRAILGRLLQLPP